MLRTSTAARMLVSRSSRIAAPCPRDSRSPVASRSRSLSSACWWRGGCESRTSSTSRRAVARGATIASPAATVRADGAEHVLVIGPARRRGGRNGRRGRTRRGTHTPSLHVVHRAFIGQRIERDAGARGASRSDLEGSARGEREADDDDDRRGRERQEACESCRAAGARSQRCPAFEEAAGADEE